MTFKLHANLFPCPLARDLFEIELRWRDPELGIFCTDYLRGCLATKIDSSNFYTTAIREFMDPQVLVQDNPYVLDDQSQPIFKYCIRCGEDKYPDLSIETWGGQMKARYTTFISHYCDRCLIVRKTVRDLNFRIAETCD